MTMDSMTARERLAFSLARYTDRLDTVEAKRWHDAMETAACTVLFDCAMEGEVVSEWIQGAARILGVDRLFEWHSDGTVSLKREEEVEEVEGGPRDFEAEEWIERIRRAEEVEAVKAVRG